MKTSRQTSRKKARPKKKARARKEPLTRPTARLTRVVTRVRSRGRFRSRDEALSVLCTVTRLEPGAEGLVLTESVGGNSFMLPVPSKAKDGRHVRDLARLEGRQVWLSLRVP